MKSITFRIMLVFTFAFMAAIFALGYLVGSRPEYYGTNMAVRIQHLSNALQRCYLYLERTQGNTAKSSQLLSQVQSIADDLSKCDDETSRIEFLREECKNRYEEYQVRSVEEPYVHANSEIYNGLVSVRSQAGLGRIGDLIRGIDDDSMADKRMVTRVLVKDVVEKSELIKRVNANCAASTAAFQQRNAPPKKPDAVTAAPLTGVVAAPVAAPVPSATKKKKKKTIIVDDDDDDAPVPVPAKKPKQLKAEEEEEEPKAGSKAPKLSEEDEIIASKKKPAPGKKPKKAPVEDEEEEEEPVAPPPKRKAPRKMEVEE